MAKPPQRLQLPPGKVADVPRETLQRFERAMTDRVIRPMKERAAARTAAVAKARSRPVRSRRA